MQRVHSLHTRLSQVLHFRRYAHHHYPDLDQANFRLFFDEATETELRYCFPEHATFYDVRPLNNGQGFIASGQEWSTIEQFYQARKLLYLQSWLGLSSTDISHLQELFRTSASPASVFTFVRTPLSSESVQQLLLSCPHPVVQRLAAQPLKHLCAAVKTAAGTTRRQCDVNHLIDPRWHRDKLHIMREALHSKYSVPALRKILVAGPARLVFVEGNLRDRFWGVFDTKLQVQGCNWLGRLLTDVRQNILLSKE